MSSPVSSYVNSQMQELKGVRTKTREQHQELGRTWQQWDCKNNLTVIQFLASSFKQFKLMLFVNYFWFIQDSQFGAITKELRDIASGEIANTLSNVFPAKTRSKDFRIIGWNNCEQFLFRKANKVKLISEKSAT